MSFTIQTGLLLRVEVGTISNNTEKADDWPVLSLVTQTVRRPTQGPEPLVYDGCWGPVSPGSLFLGVRVAFDLLEQHAIHVPEFYLLYVEWRHFLPKYTFRVPGASVPIIQLHSKWMEYLNLRDKKRLFFKIFNLFGYDGF